MRREWAPPRRRLKYAAYINPEALTEETDPDYELRYIDIGNVDSSGEIHDIAEYRFANAPTRARRRVRHGDVIISCVRTYLQAIAPIIAPPDNLVVSTGFAVVRPVPSVLDADYCKYAVRDPEFLAEIERRSVGISYPAINASELGILPIWLPGLGEQSSITDYLDRETRRIDALISEKTRWLSLLVEKQRVLTDSAVTRGLDPTALRKDSEHWWLGRVPMHWRIERARWLFDERDERATADGGELLTVSHITGVTLRSEKDVNMFEAETTEGYKICRKGDLVINTMWAWMGAMGVAKVDGIVSPSYNVYVPQIPMLSEYVDLLVRTRKFTDEVRSRSKGVWASRLRLYPEAFFDIRIPVPPIDEQQNIADYVHARGTEIIDLRSTAESTVSLLKERRSALIAAAVSGSLDIGAEI